MKIDGEILQQLFANGRNGTYNNQIVLGLQVLAPVLAIAASCSKSDNVVGKEVGVNSF